MNVVEQVPSQEVARTPEPTRYPVGSIVTLRMPGHTRTAGQEYYAPAVVLNQFDPDGQIEVLIWDSTAGTHYNPSFPIRELSVRGEGSEREMYESRSNVGEVLFDPEQMVHLSEMSALHSHSLRSIEKRIENLERMIPNNKTQPAPVHPPVSNPQADKK